ncbi:PEP/pyruvate-binding domain-containing protein [Anaerocolumna sp. MB42-C2]|uniref:PEP/pyruvate-binding domain-containing protein n=1 Tax=Anaerocolumna sp. MB42-C2 TaxID=3070997 RepID=UPI0027DF955C|nr:PEP/pyruvate-binding domain-containing protein [Anaerocolumna sp. MB42-C2]WMJ89041.1 PEP/pyruvate-binding domain-containing protein [Anaerocolumna sp. MB42-C2]
MNYAYGFQDITSEALNYTGGKGSSLCRMYKAGINVPNGFVILSTAFYNNKLKTEAFSDISKCLDLLPDGSFAVRSSALSEDSDKTSFAGEFESVLDVKKADIFSAIETVAASVQSERVTEYSKIHGIKEEHKIAVVVQIMIRAEMAGVLFSADPITGSHVNMVGNFVYGAGEQLVSGEKNAFPFTISRRKSKYQGDKSFAPYAKSMYKTTLRAEKIFGSKLDLEWVVKDKRLYIVQARPITTLKTIDYDTYEINQSLDMDALWSSNNVGEAVPDVMSPFTFSLLHEMDMECQKVPGYYMFGNICGRTYSNISVMISSLKVLGYDVKKAKELIGDVFGYIPDNIEVPIYPFSTLYLIKEMFLRAKKSLKRMKESKKQKEYYLKHTPVWYVKTLESIEKTKTRQDLLQLWTADVRPYLSALWYIWFGGAGSATLVTLRRKLSKMAGEELANLLCSNFSGEQTLVSMKPLLAIEQVINGALTPEKYLELYGHRSPHEFEVYYKYPADDPYFIENQINEFKNANLRPAELLKKQQNEFMKGKELFVQKFPGKQKWLNKKLEQLSKDANTRESLRNEFVKVFRVMRHLLLKIGSVTGIGEDIFMMYCNEVPGFLQGDTNMLDKLSKRRENFEEYQKLPVFPQLIRGRFNTKEWMNSKDKRQDYYDPNAEVIVDNKDSIKGFAGAPGTVEGVVRILYNFEEAKDFKKGEILVTTVTNIGWTPLFPKAAAIITDLGAPLSHAAIVARELGIPAVVGCGIATTELKTGDLVKVNGSTGIITKKLS